MTAKKTLRLVIALVVLVVLLLAAAALALHRVDVGAYKNAIVARLSAATGRAVHIDGKISLEVSLTPTIVVGGLRVANAGWGSAPDMLSAGRIEARVALLPLLSGHVDIRRIVLRKPVLLLERNRDGIGNWVFGTPGPGVPASGTLSGLVVGTVDVRDASIRYHDLASGRRLRVELDRLTVQGGRAGALALHAAGSVDGHPLTAGGTVTTLASLLSDQPTRVVLALASGAVKAHVDGTLGIHGQDRELNLHLVADAPDLATVARLAGTHAPVLGPLHLDTRIAREKRKWWLEDLKARVGATHITGAAAFLDVAHPGVEARFKADTLDLAPLVREFGGGKELFPRAPLPVAGLRAFDVLATLDVGRVVLRKGVALGHVALRATLHDGRLKLTPSAALAGGRVNGKVELVAGAPARAKLALDGKGIGLATLVNAFQGRHVMNGASTDLRLHLAGRGASLHDMMAGANGSLVMDVGRGRIDNGTLDLAGADVFMEVLRGLDPFSKSDSYTELRCAALRFPVRKGVASNADGIGLQTSKMNVVGGGTVNLDSEALDMALKPQPREGVGLSAGMFSSVVRIGGTLAHPRPVVSGEGLAKAGATVGAAVVTGGLSLLAGAIFDRATADAHPCATTLGKKPPAGTTRPGRATSTPTPASKQSGRVLGGALKSVEGLFSH